MAGLDFPELQIYKWVVSQLTFAPQAGLLRIIVLFIFRLAGQSNFHLLLLKSCFL